MNGGELDANGVVVATTIAITGTIHLLTLLLTSADLLPPLWLAMLPILGLLSLLALGFVVERYSTTTPTEVSSEELATDGGETDSSPGKGR